MKALLIAGLLVTGCASQQRAVRTSPTVTIAQVSRVAPLRIGIAGGLPVDYQLEITNPLDDAVTLTSVELETVGLSGAYAMKRVRHTFSLMVKSHATEVVPIRAWVQTLQETDRGDVSAPVSVRGVARFASPAGMLKTAFAARVQ